MASVAALDSHVRKLVSGIDRKFGLVLLATSGTDDATEFPFAKTKTADKTAARTFALWAQDGDGGLAIAERAQRMSVAVELQRRARPEELGVRLKKSEGQEFFRGIGRVVGFRPAVVEQIGPGIG